MDLSASATFPAMSNHCVKLLAAAITAGELPSLLSKTELEAFAENGFVNTRLRVHSRFRDSGFDGLRLRTIITCGFAWQNGRLSKH